LLDFGLAKLIDRAPPESGPRRPTDVGAGFSRPDPAMSPTITSPAMMTGAGMILGTATYMSPEQAKGRPADTRSDIWAYGCVLFELLSGRRAFEGEDVSDTLANILKREPDWSALPRDLPPAMRTLLRRCLEKDRQRRLPHIGVARLEISEQLSGAAEPVAAVTARTGRERLAWTLAGLAILATVAVSVAYLRDTPPTAALVRFTVAPPFGATRPNGEPFAVSPDGLTVAFGANDTGGVERIFTRRIDQADAQLLAGTDNARAPFWSPDGSALGFFKEGSLYRIDLDGGAPRRLCDVTGGTRGTVSGTWGTTGAIVFAASGTALWRVSETGGTPAPVTSLDVGSNEVSHASPSFLPDGRHVLFLALAAGQVTGGIWAVAIDDPKRTRIVESSGGAAYAGGWLLTTAGLTSRGLLAQAFDPVRLTLTGAARPVRDRLSGATTSGGPGFSVSLNGALAVDRPPPMTRQLTWMDRVGRVLRTVRPVASISDFGLAPDERRVAAGVTDAASGRRDLWLFDPPREEGTRLTFQVDARRPMWDLDGRHVYFTTNPNFELWSLAVGAVEPQRFDNPGRFSHFEDITRDGRSLIFRSLEAPPSIWVQRVGGPGERRALVQGAFGATQARVSPNGRWLAYTLGLPGGQEVVVEPFDRPGDRFQISRTGGMGAIWRVDSGELYYEATDGLMAVTLAERSGALEIGTPQKLFTVHTQGYAANQPHNVEVAANGQKFLVNAIVGGSDNVPIEVTLNWTAGMKK
jgi:Tol biopolymer transport system component